jgi:hypothetical protein
VTIDDIETVSAAARMVRERATWVFWSLCAAPDLVPTGVLTDREIVMAMIAKDGDARALRVVHVMSSSVYPPGTLGHLRDAGVRRVPVVGLRGQLNRDPLAGRRGRSLCSAILQPLSERSATNGGASEQPGLSRACPPAYPRFG